VHEPTVTGRLRFHENRLSRLLGNLKLDRPAGFSLPDSCKVERMAVRCHIFDFEMNNITAAELAIDRDIEKRQVSASTGQL